MAKIEKAGDHTWCQGIPAIVKRVFTDSGHSGKPTLFADLELAYPLVVKTAFGKTINLGRHQDRIPTWGLPPRTDGATWPPAPPDPEPAAEPEPSTPPSTSPSPLPPPKKGQQEMF